MPRLPISSDFPSSLTLSIVPPPLNSAMPKDPVNILILLHGLGDIHTPFASFARQLNLPETAAISLCGLSPIPPFFTGSDAPAFHWGDDILVDESKGEVDLDAGYERAIQVLNRDVVTVLIEQCGFRERNIIWFGFGQGAMAALGVATSLDHEREFGGVVSIGGRLATNTKKVAGKGRTSILVCGGSRSTQVTRSAVDKLKSAFMDVEYVKWSKGEDSMPRNKEEMMPIMKFFARRLQSRAGVPEGAIEV